MKRPADMIERVLPLFLSELSLSCLADVPKNANSAAPAATAQMIAVPKIDDPERVVVPPSGPMEIANPVYAHPPRAAPRVVQQQKNRKKFCPENACKKSSPRRESPAAATAKS